MIHIYNYIIIYTLPLILPSSKLIKKNICAKSQMFEESEEFHAIVSFKHNIKFFSDVLKSWKEYDQAK